MILYFFIGLSIGLVMHWTVMRGYRHILTQKADAPSKGMSNVEFINGKPYVIMHESDYVKNCNAWYST